MLFTTKDHPSSNHINKVLIMKISMLLTSLIVAMSALHLNDCEEAAKQKISDSNGQENNNDVIENSEVVDDNFSDMIPPNTRKH